MAYYEDEDPGLGPLAAALGLGLGAVFAGKGSAALRPISQLFEGYPRAYDLIKEAGRHGIADRFFAPGSSQRMLREDNIRDVLERFLQGVHEGDRHLVSPGFVEDDLKAMYHLADNAATSVVPMRSPSNPGFADSRLPETIFMEPAYMNRSGRIGPPNMSMLPVAIHELIHADVNRRPGGRRLHGRFLAGMLDPSVKENTLREYGHAFPTWSAQGIPEEEVFTHSLTNILDEDYSPNLLRQRVRPSLRHSPEGIASQLQQSVVHEDQDMFNHILDSLAASMGRPDTEEALATYFQSLLGGKRRDELYDRVLGMRP